MKWLENTVPSLIPDIETNELRVFPHTTKKSNQTLRVNVDYPSVNDDYPSVNVDYPSVNVDYHTKTQQV